MSRIAKLPIFLAESVRVSSQGSVIFFENDFCRSKYVLSTGVSVELVDNCIKVSVLTKNKTSSMRAGMDRSNIKNIVQGMTSGFKSVLEINGVGYKASVEKNILALTLGYSHEIFYALPLGISASFEKPNLIVLSGHDKVLIGQVSSEVISFRKTEPYKGKGVKIFGKKIIRKEGKKK